MTILEFLLAVVLLAAVVWAIVAFARGQTLERQLEESTTRAATTNIRLEQAENQVADLTAGLSRYSVLADRDAYLAGVETQIQAKQEDLARLEQELTQRARKAEAELAEQLNRRRAVLDNQRLEAERKADEARSTVGTLETRIGELQGKLRKLEEVSCLEEFGFYEFRHSFETAGEFAVALDTVRDQQKRALKDKRAAVCDTTWTVGDSKREGEKMVNGVLRMMLRAFNGECDACISRVKYNNVDTMRSRIEASSKAINDFGKTLNCRIADEYLQSKLKELELSYEYQVKKQQEAEEQRRIREQMREEERALKEAEKAREAAEKEERRYLKALDEARRELESATAGQQQKLLREIEALNARLAETENLKQRAQSMAELTRSGHVYVISNVGSFGDRVFKIGMTRRLEPMERVNELGDASVPFPFDVHAMIYSTDAPTLENQLHKHFSQRRLNLVNERKEFFQVAIEEIETALNDFARQNPSLKARMELTKVAEAEQYRQSEAKRRIYTAPMVSAAAGSY
ncbi:DUF4041 domain-containing protein [Gloeobacter morelensis]|uniref:DUF4041 domain-containing protein n=1 Tax=Gloeobacter morelensis MG652769 TaxID=2781736 RepID=A0ABY3PQ30_9CYAN|nr:DUF4041 domain-containing protein [Gloeobacter morelensis]UFP95639.1 DUF4041 domain-containing protein [Gloeobacter morelensis MG652769]